MKRAGRRGSLSIFFCLLMSALMLISASLLQIAQTNAAECDLGRALSSQIQAGLASYDRSWREFGLFGFQAKAVDTAVFTGSLPENLRSCPISLEPLEPLSDPVVLGNQIVRYMKSRVPAVYLDVLLSRLSVLWQAGSDFQPDSGLDALQRWQPGVSSLAGSLTGQEIQDAAGSLFGSLLGKVRDEALQRLQEIFQEYSAELLGVGSDDPIVVLLGEMPDFLDPEAISRLAGKLDWLLNFETAPIYEKFCLTEYILGQFRPAVLQIRLPSGSRNLSTLDGRPFTGLPDSRACEVEQILTGLGRADTAKLAIQAILTSLRSLVHLADLLTDEARMTSIKAVSGGVAASVAALTAGTVVIDPEIMTYLLVVGEAIRLGLADCHDLMAGQGVNFWPGPSPVNITFYYQDWLRLLLLLVPRATLLDRTCRQLGKVLPSPCYTRLRVTTEYKQRSFSLSGGYLG